MGLGRGLSGYRPVTITAQALALLDHFELDRPVRLLGVRLELEMPDQENTQC
ncbi:MAG: hypothetical protein WBO08_14895 [Mycobacterium sp.]|nr:hypothetical protein [Mycobacterium sp.]